MNHIKLYSRFIFIKLIVVSSIFKNKKNSNHKKHKNILTFLLHKNIKKIINTY